MHLGNTLVLGARESMVRSAKGPSSELGLCGPTWPHDLECRKWGFKRWGFKEIRGYLRKKAFFLRFLDFPGALRTLRKRAKKAEKGRKRPISKAKSGNLNLFLRILPFFPLFPCNFQGKKGKIHRKRFRLPDFADFREGRPDTP